jgi:hypothetical protein
MGLIKLTHLLVSNGFDGELIVVDHLARMAHFLPCTKTAIAKKTVSLSVHGIYGLHGLP